MQRRTIPSVDEREFLNRNLCRNVYNAMCCLNSALLVNIFPSNSSADLFVPFPTNLVSAVQLVET